MCRWSSEKISGLGTNIYHLLAYRSYGHWLNISEVIRMTGEKLQSKIGRMYVIMMTLGLLDMAKTRLVWKTLRINGKIYENVYHITVNKSMEAEGHN